MKTLMQQFNEKRMNVLGDFIKTKEFRGLSGESKEMVFFMFRDVLEHHSSLKRALLTLAAYKRMGVEDNSLSLSAVAALEYAHAFMLKQYAKKFFKLA